MRDFEKRSKSRSPRPKQKRLVFGRKPVLELLESGRAVEKIFMQRNSSGQSPPMIRHMAAEKGVPTVTVPIEKLRWLLNNPEANHQGVIALLSEIEHQQLDDIIPFIFEKGEDPLFVVLDGVTDVRNAGAIARTAWASGAHALIVASKGSASLNDQAVKASAGALNHLPVCRETSVNTALAKLKAHGIRLIGTKAGTGKYPHSMDMKAPMAFVMGSEDMGLSESAAEQMDEWISLPMKREFDSYNVSVAAGMLLYEVLRQRSV